MAILLVLGLALAQQSPAQASSPRVPDKLLLYGAGLWCVDATSGDAELWIGPNHDVTDVCWAQDRGCHDNTIFVAADGRLQRLHAASGRSVVVIPDGKEPEVPVLAGHVVQVEDCVDVATLELAPDPATGDESLPQYAHYLPTLTEATDCSFVMHARERVALDTMPDRLCMNFPLWSMKRGAGVFAWMPAEGTDALRLATPTGPLTTLTRDQLGEGFALVDVAVPAHAAFLFALAARPDGQLRLAHCGMPDGAGNYPWLVRELSERSGTRLIATDDARTLFMSEGPVVAAFDSTTLAVTARFDAAAALGASPVAVIDLCLLWSPAGGGDAPRQPLMPAATGRREESRLAALCAVTQPTGFPFYWAVVWNLGDGAVVSKTPLGSFRLTHVARLPMETCKG